MSGEKIAPERVVRSYIEAYNNNDPDLAMTYLADDFERYSNTTNDWQPMQKKEFYEMWICFQFNQRIVEFKFASPAAMIVRCN